MPLVSVLSSIERNGVKVDATMLAKQSKELETRMQEVVKQAYAAADQEFNLASPKQLGKSSTPNSACTRRAKPPRGSLPPLKMCWKNWQRKAMSCRP